jgi:hypothetical protein
MSRSTVLTLLQVVALALPAVGIYLQVLRSLHKPDPDDEIGVDSTNHMLDFNLAKSGLLIITLSGLIDVLYLILVEIPSLGTGLGPIVLPSLIILSLFSIGFGLFLFAGSVYFSFSVSFMIGQNPSMRQTIHSYVSLLYKRLNPKKSLGPDSRTQPERQDR